MDGVAGSPARAVSVAPVADVVPGTGIDASVVAAVLGVVVVVVGLGVFGRRWLRSTPGDRFRSMLAGREHVSVLLHANPDPDAMASAMAVAAIARSVDTTATFQYPGQIRHQENRAFRTVLDLSLDRISSAEGIDGDVVLVDHNEPRGFEGAERVDPISVVDHHPGSGTGTDYTDVRKKYGSCTTILAEYLNDIGATVAEEDDDAPLWIDEATATGLTYGIQSDTNGLRRGCVPADFEACSYLYSGVNEELLDRIANPLVDGATLETVARATLERDERGSFVISDVGEIPNVDAIPQAADRLLNLEGTTAVIVFGDSEGTLHLSGRSRDDRVHMGETLDAVAETIPMADAGGHARMGGGQISLEHMRGIGPGDGLSRVEFVDRLFDALEGER
ncbi:RNA-binding protein [Halobacteriales archaeon SW_7_68_16]|nr:MAG: RNA-binding protein [Halobacteriales archaeon SW_7_68_16]